ncbi:hypothetical protein Desor_4660 [Desulfosporosinus orientis DSM 765]|uniref:DUF3786 domain-containing protein n=1 Tax=Desulfosporosinus orientis (strain ATCC 19365 / DSM 765 / NCIMB 8382 / VKM B-1628 / Singapore I) TaxID=768706 RepID=G7WE88_DESOD|nr:DUF3786 domain-containing protein [Desulfosporosinus orientis]AET70064.1 hypothetical protein Desor_4660 [Desulfosporosinus orientis DSM 765]
MNYSAAHELALKKFRACSLEEMASCSGYTLKNNALQLEFLGQSYLLNYPSGSFEPLQPSARELPVPTQILILHYVTNLSDIQEVGQLISYKELPGGSIYIKPFTGRAIDPLVRIFGSDPDSLLKVASHLGGYSNGLGDVGITYKVFSRVPLSLILWRADDEFPASGNILFDASASAILPTEDFAVLASTVVFGFKGIKAALDQVVSLR